MIESDPMLDMEAQRQKERIKLNEIERKKRELAEAKKNSSESKENNRNYSKRVNIKTPVKDTESRNDNVGPLGEAKKSKRGNKPRYKKYLADEHMDMPQQKNVTPSSVSAIQLEEAPPSRASQTVVKSKSPMPSARAQTPAKEVATPRPKTNSNRHNQEQQEAREKTAHKAVNLSPEPTPQKSKTHLQTHAVKLPSIHTNRQKTELTNKLKRQVN